VTGQRPAPERLIPDYYPVQMEVSTRFQDVDPNRHLNNVAFAAIFEHGRVALHRDIRPWNDRPSGERTMVAAVTINYLAEGSYPEPVTVASGIDHIGNSSWRIAQAIFQSGRCLATCDSVIACRTDGLAKPLRTELREQLGTVATQGFMVRPD
jgi:acyl-CoA thioester hydrolase